MRLERKYEVHWAVLWMLIWKEVRRIHQNGMLLEGEHVTAHRSKKEEREMSLVECYGRQCMGG